jgi:hypothetical protein
MQIARTPLLALPVILTVCGLWIGTASAQDVARLCNGYADQAVRQNQQNLQLGCGLSGPEWNSTFTYHRDWCVQGRNWESATRWNQWRDGEIAKCRTAKTKSPAPPPAPTTVQPEPPTPQPPPKVAQLCEGYARQAAQQNRQNAELGCGLSGAQWSPDYRYHYDWCVQGRNWESATRWNQWRDGELAKCRVAKTKPPAPQPPSPQPPAPQPAAVQICEGYARQAVQQNQQNTQLSCGLSGPQWNSEYRYHFDWCVQGRNSEAAPRWNQWRDGEIAKCRIAKAKPAPAPDVTKAQPSVWDAALARLPELVQSLEQKTSVSVNKAANAQTQRAQQQAEAHRKLLALRALPPDTGVLKRIDEAATAFQRRPGTAALTIPESVTQPRPPQITTVVVEPRKDVVEPSSVILIGGLNFRDQPGRNRPGHIFLRYSDFRAEFGPPPKSYDVALMPLKGTWEDSWTDSLILVRVPNTLPGENFLTDRTAQIIITFADGVSLARNVTINAGMPAITEIATSSGIVEDCCLHVMREEWRRLEGTTSLILQPINYIRAELGGPRRHWVQPGDTVFIVGRHFGNTPGKAYLAMKRAIGGRAIVQLVTLKPEDWSDTKISLRAEDFLTAGYVEMQTATLVLETASGREAINNDFAFGPEMGLKIVSGFKWLEGPEEIKRQYARPAPNGAAMLVTHMPDCSYIAAVKGERKEKGVDRYRFPLTFRTEELYEAAIRGAQGAKVIKVSFKHINPGSPDNELEFFVDRLADFVNAVLSEGPLGLIKFGVTTFVKLLATGSYYTDLDIGAAYDGGAYVGPATGAGILWETSCGELVGGKPIIYAISFVVVGPKKVLDAQ